MIQSSSCPLLSIKKPSKVSDEAFFKKLRNNTIFLKKAAFKNFYPVIKLPAPGLHDKGAAMKTA
ncbi:hypothetical protein [Komagataeibacter xylinus]|uniref:hypothetical protein n=1 Tax=Komagataeibacter xylinus TaxID=28448 RepID=UPI001030F33F|nr:hypothetical protein [Komagataeibacter xylinus]